MIQDVLLLHLLREQDHQHSFYLQKFLDEYPRDQTVKPLLIDTIFMVIEPSRLCDDLHGFLIDVIVDLDSQHLVEVVKASDGVVGVVVEGAKDLLDEVEGFKLFLHEGQQMVYCVWYEVSVLFLLHDAFVGLCSIVWSVVIVTSSLSSAPSSFFPLLRPFRPLSSLIFFANVQPRREKFRLLNSITRRCALFQLRHIFPDHRWLLLIRIGRFIGIGKLLVEGISSYQDIVEGKIELKQHRSYHLL